MMLLLQSLVLLIFITQISGRNLAEVPVKLSLIYYELDGKGTYGTSYKFKLDPIHRPPPCETRQPNDCNLMFQFERCQSEADNSTCTTTTLHGLPQSAFYTCDPKVKRYLNGLAKPINGSRPECLSTTLNGQGRRINVTVLREDNNNNNQNNSPQSATATTPKTVVIGRESIPLGRGRSLTQMTCANRDEGRHIKIMLYQDDIDEHYQLPAA